MRPGAAHRTRGRPEVVKVPRWSAEGRAPDILGARRLESVFACRVKARSGCGEPHQRLSALRAKPATADGM
jgi:hypothetical protein